MKDGISAADFSNHRLWAADLHASRVAQRGFTGPTGLMYAHELGDFKAYSGSFDADTIKEIAKSNQVR